MSHRPFEPFRLREPLSGEPQLYCNYVAPPFGRRILVGLAIPYRWLFVLCTRARHALRPAPRDHAPSMGGELSSQLNHVPKRRGEIMS